MVQPAGKIQRRIGTESRSRSRYHPSIYSKPQDTIKKIPHISIKDAKDLIITDYPEYSGQNSQNVTAIILTYNQAPIIRSIVIQTRLQVDHVIVIDNGSTDNTGEIARLSGAEVIIVQENVGRAHAILTGLRWAKDHNYNVAVVLDGGGKHDPSEIPAMVRPFLSGNTDITLGSRLADTYTNQLLSSEKDQNSAIVGIDRTSQLQGRILDYGFFAIGPRALENLPSSIETNDNELALIRTLENAGLSLVEVPIKNAKQPRTLVAMPAYNEEIHIAKTITGALPYADQVLVVDDGSTDDTGLIARLLGARVVTHQINKGYGGALQTIFETARKTGAEELVIIDADGQHNPQDIPQLLKRLRDDSNHADVVIGSRFIDGTADTIPLYRKFGMKVLDRATSIAGNNITISDSQSGFRAYGRNAIEAITIHGDGMSAGSEILIRISDNQLKVAEVPIKVRYDIEGTSSQNPMSHGIGVLMNVIRMISIRHPLVFFGIPGLLLTSIGLGAEIFTFSQYVRTGQFHYLIFTSGFSLLILGLLLITAGLILYAMMHVVREQTIYKMAVKS